MAKFLHIADIHLGISRYRRFSKADRTRDFFNAWDDCINKYALAENVITLTDTEGQNACDGPGKYKWKLQENSLHFEKIEDDCDGRAGALAQPWVKK